MAGRSGFFRNGACCCYGLFILATLLLLPAVGEARGFFMQRPVRSWIDTPKWDLDLGYRYQSIERSGPGGSDESSRHVFTEGFTVTSRGWTYHPALLRYNLSLSPSWEQERRQEVNGRRNSRDQMRLEYAIDGTLLAIKPYATDFYAERDSTTRSNDRAQATTVDRTSYGAALYLPWGRENVPTRIAYGHRDSTSESGGSATTSSSDRFSLSSNYVRQRHRTSLRAGYSDTRQKSSAGRSSDSQLSSGSLQNTLYLTADRQLRLSSQLSASLSQSSSADDRERLSLSEELRWDRRHSPNLRSYYLGRYTHNRNDDLTDNSYQLESGLNHQLYENLNTNLSGSALRTTTDTSKNTSYGANLGMNYNRRIPTGSVQLNMSQGYVVNQREQLARQETKTVERNLGECLDVDGLLPLTCEFDLEDIGVTIIANSLELIRLLPPPNADEQPIELKDIGLSPLPFEEGRKAGQQIIRFTDTNLEALNQLFRDYLNDQTRDIYSEGWLLELSYDVESDPSYDSATWNHSYGARLNVFSNWTLYYRTSFAEERFLAGTPPDRLTDNRSYATGIGWNKRMERNSLHSAYDYTESTSADSTSRSHAINAGIDRSLVWLPATWNNNASYSITTTDARTTINLAEINDPPFLADQIFADENVAYRLTSAVDFRLSRGRQLRLQGGYSRTTTDGTTTVDGQQDTFSLREADDYNIAADLRLSRNLSANLSASFRQSEATSDSRPPREEERILIRSRLRQQVSRTSRLELDGSYRSRTSNQPYEDELYTLGGRYEYRHRLLRLTFDYRYSDDRNLLADSRVIGHAVMVTFKRALN